MGIVQVETPSGVHEIPLTEVNLVGRHPACGIVLNSSRVPMFWVEVRWSGTRWTWRTLAGEERTRGPGAVSPDGWRPFANGTGRTGIRVGDVCLRLIEDRAPEPVVEWLDTAERDLASDFDGLHIVDVHTIEVDSGEPVTIPSGGTTVLDGRPVRIWVPSGWLNTESPYLSLASETLELDFGWEACEVTLTDHTTSLTLKSEDVRLLRVYAQARLAAGKAADAGYLTTEEAFRAWVELGGNPQSEPERLSWMRNRLRIQLDQHGVGAPDGLFERRRMGPTWQHRVSIPGERLQLPLDSRP